MTIRTKFVFRLSQIQCRPYCYTHSNQTLYNITNKIYHNPGPFLAPFYVLKPSSKTECLSQKSCTASGGGPIFPGCIPKIFWTIRAGSDFSRAYLQNFFAYSGQRRFFQAFAYPFSIFPDPVGIRFFQADAYLLSIFLSAADMRFFRVSAKFFCVFLTDSIFPGRYPLEFFWHQGKCDFSSGSQTVCSLLRLLTSRKH